MVLREGVLIFFLIIMVRKENIFTLHGMSVRQIYKG